jgi:hypothetical protein
VNDPTAIRQAYVSPNASVKATTDCRPNKSSELDQVRPSKRPWCKHGLQIASLRVSYGYQLVFRGLTTVGDTGI